MTDPIADMLTRIRNALAVRKREVVLPYSKMKMTIAGILKQEGMIANVEKVERSEATANFDQMKIVLKYTGSREPAITNLKKVSKPGRRVYVSKDEIPIVLNNLGIAIISTSRGLMTNKQAKAAGVGGELICEIY